MVMMPVMPEAMEFMAFMSPHFMQMPAFVARNSAVMETSSAAHFITKLIMMQTS